MILRASGLRRNVLAPEVVQTSAMDCGPASLKCLLEGFGIPVSYGRLREACQTGVDGTSIDVVEEVARQLGLDAEQVLLPADHFLLPEVHALPAIVVTRRPTGEAHFAVVWRRHGRLVQVMDPATGRRWPTCSSLRRECYQHEMPVAASAWRSWADSDEFLAPVEMLIRGLGVPRAAARGLLGNAMAERGWEGPATLDAATRMIGTVVRAGGLRRGREAGQALETVYARARAEGTTGRVIPAPFWLVRPPPPTTVEPPPPGPDTRGESPPDAPVVLARGAVLVRARRPERRPVRGAPAPTEPEGAAPLAAELVAALGEPPSRPWRDLLALLRADGLLTPLLLAAGLMLAAAGLIVEALLFRAFVDLGASMGGGLERVGALGVCAGFAAILLLLELPLTAGLLRSGRRLELRLRSAFLRKIPRLADRYFHSRPASDMAERGHTVQVLRFLPTLGGQLIRAACTLLLTAAAICWLDPRLAAPALAAAAFSVLLPALAQPLLRERDLRVRTHSGALSRFYLDALLGIVAIRAHGAERSVRREHEGLLAEWVRAGLRMQRATVLVDGALAVVGFALAAWILVDHWQRVGEGAQALLLAYWALALPTIGQEVASLARQYPSHRNVAMRLFEPLGALEDDEPTDGAAAPAGIGGAAARGAAIDLRGVAVRAAGQSILQDIDLSIPSGSHVAIVGASGAGKSSLVGLLLGWHKPAAGEVLVDGAPLHGARLQELRRRTAWVDPAVQLWNRSFADNLCYGCEAPTDALPHVIGQADLLELLQTLPQGLQTPLGEGGAFLSGGEGQRLRLGRALVRRDARLVILDEPFRGLDGATRARMLKRARAWWRSATLLCITHDLAHTQAFDRVVVLDEGRIAEDGAPGALSDDPTSRFAMMLRTEREVREAIWSGGDWRRLTLVGGRLVEERGGGQA